MANKNLTEYYYEARTADGRFVEGKTKAENPKIVSNYLIGLGYIPLSVKSQTGLNSDISFGGNKGKRVKPKLVAQFVRQFATLNEAGIPISRSLDVLRDQQEHPGFRGVIAQIRKDIDTGATLGLAVEKHAETFPPIAASMIKAGEAGGFLTETLKSIAETLEADVRLRGKIKSAMTYPVAILILALLLVTGMLLFIVPIFDDMFAQLGGDLPVATQLLVSLSAFMQNYGLILVGVIVAISITWNRNKHKLSVRRAVDPIKLKMPVFGKLLQKIAIARFTQNFGALLAAGLPLMQVLDIVGSTSGNTVIEDALIDVKKGVSQGEQIAPQLLKHDIFPKMLVEMLSIGEDAGEIPNMMERITISYNEEVDVMTESLSALMEPIMLMFLGGLVGSMVIALYLPIFSVSDLVA